MSQPEPAWSEEEQELLRSAALDAPSRGAGERTLAALGIGSVALGGALAASSAKAAAGGGKAVMLSKLLAVVVTVGVASGAVLHYRSPANERAAVVPRARPTAALPVATMPAEPARDVSAPAVSEPEPAPSAVKTPPAPARSEPDIALEIESLDRARRASERGDFNGALAELDGYEHAFKHGRLRPEALLLRVQTLISKGDAAGAKALGNRFLARYPKSPLAPRIQKLIGTVRE